LLHEWFRLVLEKSVQLALVILPAAPLLGQKLSFIAHEEKDIRGNHPTVFRSEEPNFRKRRATKFCKGGICLPLQAHLINIVRWPPCRRIHRMFRLEHPRADG
jgi:hypothetical protein